MRVVRRPLSVARPYWPIISCLAPLLFAASPAAAQSVGLAAEMPLGGYYRVGRWVPLNCALINQGPPADVQVSAQMRDYTPNSPVRTYELSVSLPSPANRRYSLYLMPPVSYSPRPLEVQLLQGRRVLAKQEVSLRALNDGDRLVAVLTTQEGRFGGLAGTRVPGAPSSLPPGYSPNPGPGQVQVAYVKPELAPDRAIGYQIADLIILSGVPTGALSPAQEMALTRWVQSGGTLIVTGGAEPGALQTPAMRALLPVEITGTVTLSGVQAFGRSGVQEQWLPGLSGRRSDRLNASFVATACRPKAGAKVLEARPGVPILAEWPVGAGRVAFFAADPSRPPLRGWDGISDLWRAYLRYPTPATQYLAAIDRVNQSSGYGPPGGYGGPYGHPPLLANACLQVSQMDVPGFAFIGLFLLSYIVVLVPVNYLVLKRRDRRELAWVTTPAIVLTFSVLAYLIGYGTKGGRVVLAQSGVVEAWAGRRAAPALTHLGLFSPSKSRYELESADGAVPLMVAETGGDADRRSLRVVQGDAFRLKEVPVDMWDMAVFRGDSIVDLGEGFQADLKVVDGKLVGRVVNRTPFDLEGVALLTGGGSLVKWGAFRRGETRVVAGAWTPGGSGAMLPSAVLEMVRGRSAPMRMRRALVEPMTTWNPGLQNQYPGGPRSGGPTWAPADHPVLLGWVTRPVVPTRVNGRDVNTQAAHLFLVHLPLKGSG